MIRKTRRVGIAIENNCAMVFIDGEFYRVLTSKSYAKAYTVYRKERDVVSKRIPQVRVARRKAKTIKVRRYRRGVAAA